VFGLAAASIVVAAILQVYAERGITVSGRASHYRNLRLSAFAEWGRAVA